MVAPILDHMTALSDSTRCRMLLLLEKHELTVSELCAVLQLPQSTVSRHLKTLGDDDWVTSRRDGTSRFYTMPADELMPATLEYARAMATQISPSSLRESKRQLYADLHGDVGTAVAESERLLDRMATEPDFREGVAAWREKRPPHFSGF